MRYSELIVGKRKPVRFSADDLSLPSLTADILRARLPTLGTSPVSEATDRPDLELLSPAQVEWSVSELVNAIKARYPDVEQRAPGLLDSLASMLASALEGIGKVLWQAIGPLITGGLGSATEELKTLPRDMKVAAERGLREGLKKALPRLGNVVVQALRAENPAGSLETGANEVFTELIRSVGRSVAEAVKQKAAQELPIAMLEGAVESAVRNWMYSSSTPHPTQTQPSKMSVPKRQVISHMLAAIEAQAPSLENSFDLTPADIAWVKEQAKQDLLNWMSSLPDKIDLSLLPVIKSFTDLSRYATKRLASRGKLKLKDYLAAFENDALWEAIDSMLGREEASIEVWDLVLQDPRTFSSIDDAEKAFYQLLRDFLSQKLSS